MEVQHLAAALELKVVDAEQRIIEGYAACFGNLDRNGDVIEPGAFSRSMTERKPVVFIGHNIYGLPIGKALELREDAKGLFTRSYIFEGDEGDRLLHVAKDGLTNEGPRMGMSIGYKAKVYEWHEGAGGMMVRHLKDVDLFEYSFLASVDIAANPEAVLTGVKSAESHSAADRIGQFGARLLAMSQAAGEEQKAMERLGMNTNEGRVLQHKTAAEIKAVIAGLQELVPDGESHVLSEDDVRRAAQEAETKREAQGQEPVSVTGVWLRNASNDGLRAQVLVETEGKWRKVIDEPLDQDSIVSHIVEPLGVKEAPLDDISTKSDEPAATGSDPAHDGSGEDAETYEYELRLLEV